MDFLKQLWATLRSNPVFVAAYSASAGAVVSYLQGALTTQGFSFGNVNWQQMGTLALTAAVLAVLHLYQTPPGGNPTK